MTNPVTSVASFVWCATGDHLAVFPDNIDKCHRCVVSPRRTPDFDINARKCLIFIGVTYKSATTERTGLTNLSERGVGVRTLMAIAGHANMSTTQRYIDMRPSVIRAAVELV